MSTLLPKNDHAKIMLCFPFNIIILHFSLRVLSNFPFIHFWKSLYVILTEFLIFKILSCSRSLRRAPFDTSQWLIGLPCLNKADLTWEMHGDWKYFNSWNFSSSWLKNVELTVTYMSSLWITVPLLFSIWTCKSERKGGKTWKWRYSRPRLC